MMTLHSGSEALFLDIFEDVKLQIRSQKGCMGLELLRSEKDGKPCLWTISTWASETDLESYRNSDLFQKTWSTVKPLFSEKTQAWTLDPIESLS